MPYGFLNSSITSSVYNYCYLNSHSDNYYDIEDKYIHSDLKSSFPLNSHTADSGKYSGVTFNGLVVDGIFFYASSFEDVTINLNSNNFIALWDCKMNDLKINLISSNNNTGPAYVFIPLKETGNINLGPGIEVIALSNFKNQLYETVYTKYDKIDKKTDLFRSINEFEDLLLTVSDKRRSLKNLSELYMMTYDTLFYSRIEKLLGELENELAISKSGNNPNLEYVPDDEGIYLMLQSSFAILRNKKEARDSYFNKYRDWVYSDAKFEAERKLGLWDFGTWNDQMLLNADVISDNQIELFNLLQTMAFNAINESAAIREYQQFTEAREDMEYDDKIKQITNIYYEQKRISNLRKKGY